MMKKEVVCIVIVFILIFLFGCDTSEENGFIKKIVSDRNITNKTVEIPHFEPEYDVVFQVLKGDFLRFIPEKRFSLIGVNAPEDYEPCYKESIKKLEELVLNKNVTLQRDIDDRDYFGRPTRYVFVDDGIFVNEMMLRSGFAKLDNSSENSNYSHLFYEAEMDAMSKRLCVWKDLEGDLCLTLTTFNYDAESVDEFNLNDEFVVFRNICRVSIDLTGWTIEDSGEMYIFPEFTIGPEASVKIYSGSGEDSISDLYWNSEIAIWDDDGGSLYLRNPNGNLIIKHNF
ncbi:MAG: lamin tail domain-containing protein [Nanoarchaeota archaeon]|nr:lamin tail domain-containing protein [Nanoarchaeota archaeon]